MSRLSDLERGRAGAEPSEPAPLGHRGDDTRWVSGHGSGVAGSQSQPQQTPGIGFIMMLNCGRAAWVISLYNVRAIIFYVNLSTYIYNFSYFFTFSTIPYYTEQRRLTWTSCSKPAAAQASAFQQSTSDFSQEEHSWKAQLLQHFRLWPHCSEKQDFISLRPLICKSVMDLKWGSAANTSLKFLCPLVPF